MTGRESLGIEELLNHPVAKEVTSNDSPEMIERRSYIPPVCKPFEYQYSVLQENCDYRFDLDLETRKKLPNIIDGKVQIVNGVDSCDDSVKETITKKRNIGIVFSGGPSPGGHNVIAGLFDAAKKANPENVVYGFLLGPDGIIENEVVELDKDTVDAYRNLGGFSMIKTGRTKIDSENKMNLSRKTCRDLGLDAIVVVGGDDSNTNAAFMAQEMFGDGVQVIGVPKTIDGDIQVKTADGEVLCAMSFGFHTAARAFAKNVSDLCTDSSSDVKYWHICKVMGRVASHLALEVALQSHANITLIGEDLADYIDEKRIEKAESEGRVDYTAFGMTLRHLSRIICNGIVKRAAVGKNYGVIVIPEGVLEFINEIQVFIIKLNTIIADYNKTHDNEFHTDFPTLDDKLDYLRKLARRSRENGNSAIWNTRDDDLFNDIPPFFQEGLLIERDSHGNFQFSQVETDKIIMDMVKDHLNTLKEKGKYKIGIERGYFHKFLTVSGLAPEYYGPVLFKNYEDGEYLLVKESIMSVKTLKNVLVDEGVLGADEEIPKTIVNIYKKSIPSLKTQRHFYGYDGRGGDPTHFDCNYTYNLGLTVFSLIAGGATGQMAAIKNLEKDFSQWQPIGIPIAPLMHLEERGGKLALVIEKSVVETDSNAFRVLKAKRKEWLAANTSEDCYRNPGPLRFTGKSEEEKPITLVLNAIGRNGG